MHLLHNMPKETHMHLFYMDGEKKLLHCNSLACDSYYQLFLLHNCHSLSPLSLPHLHTQTWENSELHYNVAHFHRLLILLYKNLNSLQHHFTYSFVVPAMASKSLFLLCFFSSTLSFFLQLQAAKPNSNNPQITVMGMVYCDFCSNNSFSRHSYFLPGVEVRVDCMFKAISPRTAEQISFSVNRTTDKYGIYKLEIPYVDGVQCARDKAVANACRASLLSTSTKACSVPSFRATSDEISIKSRRANVCIYSLSALSYRPSKRDVALCGK